MSYNIASQNPGAIASELDAINSILINYGETPVSTLEGELPLDVAIARSVLKDVIREIQLEQWHFNREKNYPLVPNMDTDEIEVPYNMVAVHAKGQGNNVTIRNGRLYDMDNHTYKFSSRIEADVTFILPFEELPEAFKYYSVVRAGRLTQEKIVGAPDLASFNAVTEARAQMLAVREDNLQADHSMADSTQATFLNGWIPGDVLSR